LLPFYTNPFCDLNSAQFPDRNCFTRADFFFTLEDALFQNYKKE